MKSWKEQLLNVKRLLQGTFSGKDEKVKEEPERKAADKPNSVDFVPPTSWFDEPPEDGPVTQPRPLQRSTIEPSKEPPRAITPPLGPRPSGERKHAVGVKKCPDTAPKREDARAAGNAKSNAAGVSQTFADNIDGRHTPLSSGPTLSEFRPRIDPNRRMNMPDWGARGMSLQHPDHHGGRAAPMVVRVGIDFGTAFTKVAIRAGVDLVSVDWSSVTGDVSPIGRYVMPGFVCRAPNGEYGWLPFEASDIVGNLKLPILEMVGSDKCPTATLAYLALIIRYARAFLYRHDDIGRKLKERSLRWELNIGCPTEPHEHPEIVDLFRRVARTAWWLARVEPLADSTIFDVWQKSVADVGLETEPGVVPEFVAHIACYLKSFRATEGLHALVDVGAATLDVATFNVVLPSKRENTPSIPILFSAVRPFGTHYFSKERHSRLGLDLVWDDSAPVESANDFASRYDRSPSEVNKTDNDFKDKVMKCILKVLMNTWRCSSGAPYSQAWHDGLRIFVTGGGASCVLYRGAVDIARREFTWNTRDRPWGEFKFIELDALEAISLPCGREAANRTAVAIGLTEDAETTALIIPHREFKPIKLPVRNFVDHTELYTD